MVDPRLDGRRNGSTAERRARICMPTSRAVARRVFQCGLYEAQDVLHEIDDVDLVALEATPGFRVRQRWQRRLLYRDISRRLIFANPGLKRVRLDRDYDLFVAVCQNYWDLLYINAIDNWKDRCRASVCWIDEVWAADLPMARYWLHALKRFDHVFVGYRGTAVPLTEAIGQTCRWLPYAVDALRFSPHPAPPRRVVDVYSVGRRWQSLHERLLAAAGCGDIFYVHDTFSAADAEVYDHRQHRELLANTAKRSRYFVVAPGKTDMPQETQGQVEVGYRYYEGATAGTVMVGQAPACEAFEEMFPWPEAVIPARFDGSDVMDILAGLDSDPDRAAAISARNARESLLRHDWVYRWEEILKTAGIEPSAAAKARRLRLEGLAAAIPIS